MSINIADERVLHINLIKDKLSKWEEWDRQSPELKSKQVMLIERGCHNYTIDIADDEGYEKKFDDRLFAMTYSSLIHKILSNLDVKDDNSQLINFIMWNCDKSDDNYDATSTLKYENPLLSLAKMSAEELCPNSNKQIRDVLESRKKQVIKKNICKLFTCPKCKHNETTTETKQSKALDEGSTQYIKCERCQYRWHLS